MTFYGKLVSLVNIFGVLFNAFLFINFTEKKKKHDKEKRFVNINN